MKVLILTPSIEKVGGVQRYSKVLIEAFEDLLGRENVSRMTLPDAQPNSHGTRISRLAKLWFTCRALLRTASFWPDLVVCCHVGAAPIGGLLQTAFRRPYWVIAYGIDVWCRLPNNKKRALREAERVISLSDFTSQQVVALHQVATARSVTLTPCLASEHWLKVSPSDDVLKDRGLEGCRVILTVARLDASERYKGHDVILRSLPSVIEHVPRLKYLIVGDGDDRPRLEELVHDLHLENHTVFLGEIRRDEQLAACYRACDVFALPARTVIGESDSKGEGFGIVYLEAMVFSKPIIGPNYGAPAGIIQHGKQGLLVDPVDSTAIAADYTDN